MVYAASRAYIPQDRVSALFEMGQSLKYQVDWIKVKYKRYVDTFILYVIVDLVSA